MKETIRPTVILDKQIGTDITHFFVMVDFLHPAFYPRSERERIAEVEETSNVRGVGSGEIAFRQDDPNDIW